MGIKSQTIAPTLEIDKNFAQNIQKSFGSTKTLESIKNKWLQLGKKNMIKEGQRAGVLTTRVHDMKETSYSGAYSGVCANIQQ